MEFTPPSCSGLKNGGVTTKDVVVPVVAAPERIGRRNKAGGIAPPTVSNSKKVCIGSGKYNDDNDGMFIV